LAAAAAEFYATAENQPKKKIGQADAAEYKFICPV